MKELPNSFKNYVSAFNFKRISIFDFHKFYINRHGRETKQQLSKWLTLFCEQNGYEMINTVSNGIRYYSFIKLSEPFGVETALLMTPGEGMEIENKYLYLAKKTIQSLRYRTNSVFKVYKNKDTGIYSLFRTN